MHTVRKAIAMTLRLEGCGLTRWCARARFSPGRQFHAGDDGGDYATMLAKAGRCNATKLLSARGMVGEREKHSPFPARALEDASPGAVPRLGTSDSLDDGSYSPPAPSVRAERCRPHRPAHLSSLSFSLASAACPRAPRHVLTAWCA